MPFDNLGFQEQARDFVAPHGTDPVLEAQSIFDSVCRHLSEQGGKSVDPTLGCSYRGPNGTKCAVGFLLGDDEYSPSMEGKVAQLIGLPPRLQSHASMLASLQNAHDLNSTGANLRSDLWDIASQYNLSPNILGGLSFPAEWSPISSRRSEV